MNKFSIPASGTGQSFPPRLRMHVLRITRFTKLCHSLAAGPYECIYIYIYISVEGWRLDVH